MILLIPKTQYSQLELSLYLSILKSTFSFSNTKMTTTNSKPTKTTKVTIPASNKFSEKSFTPDSQNSTPNLFFEFFVEHFLELLGRAALLGVLLEAAQNGAFDELVHALGKIEPAVMPLTRCFRTPSRAAGSKFRCCRTRRALRP